MVEKILFFWSNFLWNLKIKFLLVYVRVYYQQNPETHNSIAANSSVLGGRFQVFTLIFRLPIFLFRHSKKISREEEKSIIRIFETSRNTENYDFSVIIVGMWLKLQSYRQ